MWTEDKIMQVLHILSKITRKEMHLVFGEETVNVNGECLNAIQVPGHLKVAPCNNL